MKIAICEDNLVQQRNLKAMVEAWELARGGKVQIRLYQAGSPFLFDWSSRPDYDLLLLDVDLGTDPNGMELARQIRRKDDKIQIVFVTGLAEYAMEGYDVAATHFLVKPVAAEKLWQVLDKVCAAAEKKEEYLLLTGEAETELIPVGRILYAEAFSHVADLYMEPGEPGGRQAQCRRVRLGMKELEGKLSPSSFFRCHRSYLVHLAHVRKISRNQAFLDHGLWVPVSRSREKLFYQAFLAYHGSQELC